MSEPDWAKFPNSCHPSHKTRVSIDASTWDEICVRCGYTDIAAGGWGRLRMPCPNEDAIWERWDVPRPPMWVQEHDRLLREFIARRQGQACDANSADFKTTSNYELEQIKADSRNHYLNTKALLETLSERRMGMMRKYSQLRNKDLGYEHKLEEFDQFLLRDRSADIPAHTVKHKWYVGPKWLCYHDEFLMYEAVFA